MFKERQALFAESTCPVGPANDATGMLPYAAVADLDTVEQTPTFLRHRHPVSFAGLDGSKGDVKIQICDSLGYQALWAHVDNATYRADYLTFLRKQYNFDEEKLPTDYHVDHLYNNARAKADGLQWVRLVLLPAHVNVSHGAGYEKARLHGIRGTLGRPRPVDEIVLMKLCGVSSPRKGLPLTAPMHAHVQNIAKQFNQPISEIEGSIRRLMEVAAFRPKD